MNVYNCLTIIPVSLFDISSSHSALRNLHDVAHFKLLRNIHRLRWFGKSMLDAFTLFL